MNNYIDLVLAKTTADKPKLYFAPPYSHIEKGGYVVVKDSLDHDVLAKVYDVITARKDSDEYVFMLNVNGKEIKPVLYRTEKLLVQEGEEDCSPKD